MAFFIPPIIPPFTLFFGLDILEWINKGKGKGKKGGEKGGGKEGMEGGRKDGPC